MKRRISSPSSGFTLLEVLVSTVLLGTVVVAMLGLSSQSLRNIARMKPQEAALLHAREKMNEILLREELEPIVQSGRWNDGAAWQVQISPSGRDAQLQDQTFSLFQIRLIVSWMDADKTKTYTVETTEWARRVVPNASK
jgi:prepilin-type N-terminal cleavage/methylation domain-containing protein